MSLRVLILKQEIYMKLFQRLQSFFSNVLKSAEPLHPFVLIYEFRHEKIPESALEDWRSQIVQLQSLACQVIEKELQVQIPDEYIGIASWWCEGKLLSREYLKIQEECVVKISSSSKKIDLSIQPEV